MSVRNGLRLAVGTSTILPSGGLPRIDQHTARTAMLLTPVAVLPVAAVAAAGGVLAVRWGVPPVAAGAVIVGLLAYGTRAMHLDGLADTVDGLGGGWTRERALQIMRSGDIGPMGVATLVCTLLVQAGVLGALVTSWRGWLVATLAIATSRAATALACLRQIPAAREEGLGATVAGSVPAPTALGQLLVCTLALGSAAWWWQTTPGSPHRWWLGLLALPLAMAGVLALLRRAITRIGGVSGDVIGACIEVALCITCVVLAGGLR